MVEMFRHHIHKECLMSLRYLQLYVSHIINYFTLKVHGFGQKKYCDIAQYLMVNEFERCQLDQDKFA